MEPMTPHLDGSQQRALQVGRLVEQFVTENAGFAHALVLSTDGIGLARSSQLKRDQAERIAATASGLFALSGRIGDELDMEAFEQTVLRYAAGHIIVSALGNSAALAVVTDKTANLAAVAYAASTFALKVGHLLTPEVRSELRGGAG